MHPSTLSLTDASTAYETVYLAGRNPGAADTEEYLTDLHQLVEFLQTRSSVTRVQDAQRSCAARFIQAGLDIEELRLTGVEPFEWSAGSDQSRTAKTDIRAIDEAWSTDRVVTTSEAGSGWMLHCFCRVRRRCSEAGRVDRSSL
jgi:hypothetical protein